MKDNTFEIVYKEYYHAIYRYCYHKLQNHHTAEDITSETFLLLYEKWSTYQSHPKEGVLVWLYRTAQFKIMAHVRSAAEVPLESVGQYGAPADFDQEADARAYAGYVDAIKKSLKGKDAHLFSYVVEEERKISEIAGLLRISEHAVRLRWYRVRKKIETLLPHIMR